MRGVVERPAGLVYEPELIDRATERALLDRLAHLDLEPVVMRGRAARRTVRHFGYGYDFDSWELRPTDPLPPWLVSVRQSASVLADRPPDHFEQALVTCYPPGASIGWHRDANAFGGVVLGLSLGTPAAMRFQRKAAGGERRVFEQPLEPRSAYVLAGAARSVWQHSVPAVAAVRYSLTFRSVRRSARDGSDKLE